MRGDITVTSKEGEGSNFILAFPAKISMEVKEFTDILEERKEGTTFLRAHQISGRTYEQLNEHSTAEDITRLTKLCAEKNVALITDCGTPGFMDPGADLVRSCRQAKIPIRSIPGPSSLMTLLSLTGQRLESFYRLNNP